jgi:hypothetical protein
MPGQIGLGGAIGAGNNPGAGYNPGAGAGGGNPGDGPVYDADYKVVDDDKQ